ncbi:uncharacterized protein LOC128724995 [Anopheles nili]|uniref:uncharacterized protein LOC128724995 n=1 Tax=Anopheles nili TaxID=185578 RepID=UPI00237C2B65|nr:uncharacterized protein LOC128724995 [Anopheles nili]
MGVLAGVLFCGLFAIIKLVNVPMPFFTSVLYVNEIVLCVFLTIVTVVRGCSERLRYNKFFETVLALSMATPVSDWANILRSLQIRMQWIFAAFASLAALVVLCDYLHFGSFYATLLTLGTYVIPNALVTMSLGQYCYGVFLVHKLQEHINRRLHGPCLHENSLEEAKHYYLHLSRCFELIIRSYEVIIVGNTLAGINVTSLQLLEIYQYLQANELSWVYFSYNGLWIMFQCCMLLMILYPSHLVKREVTKVH